MEKDAEDVEASEEGLEDTIFDEYTLVVNVGASVVLFLVEKLVVAVSIVSMVVVEHGDAGVEILPLVVAKLEFCEEGVEMARPQDFKFMEEGI